MFDILLVMALGSAFLAVAIIVLVVDSTYENRKRAVKLLEAGITSSAAPTANLREKELRKSFIQRVILPALGSFGRFGRRVTPFDSADRIEMRLKEAGSPQAWDAARVVAVKLITGAFGLVASLTLAATQEATFAASVLVVGLGTWGSYMLPDLRLMQKARERQNEIRKAMPDTMDLLTIIVEAGLGFDAALAHVIQKVPGPLADEYGRTLHEIRLGVPRADALRNMADRTNIEEVRSFVTSMVQAESFGVSITKVIRAQSHDLRSKRRANAEKKAQQLAVKMIFPLIFCILPAVLVVAMGPGVIRIVQTFL